MADKILFLYNNAFSGKGGIQEFNKNFIKALNSISSSEYNYQVCVFSLNDLPADLPGWSNVKISTATGSKLKFLLKAISSGLSSDKIIFGHLYISVPLIYLFKVLRKKTTLITHGVEIWKAKSKYILKTLSLFDLILTVSEFTKKRIIECTGVPSSKIQVFPNTINPDKTFQKKVKDPRLLKKYKINENDKILLTVCRLSYTEKEKGYDKILEALPLILKRFPEIRYIIAGKSDTSEKERLALLIQQRNITEKVIMAGEVSDEELMKIYPMADLFIMPSKKEGFGIVFIESILSGTPVIGGNKDGSAEALCNGDAGFLVDPDDLEQIKDSVIAFFEKKWPSHLYNMEQSQKKIIGLFGFDRFTDRLRKIIGH